MATRNHLVNIPNFCNKDHKNVREIITEKYYKLRIHYEKKVA